MRSVTRRPSVAMVAAAAALVGSSLVWNTSPLGAAFPGGNGAIACASFRDGDSEIFTFSPSGTEQGVKQLTFNTASDSRPRYSPDGRKIAFESTMDGPQELYVMNADGTGLRRLTFSGVAGAHGNSSPAWSPGGDQIAYQSTRNGSFDVYRIDIDGTNDTRLTFSAVEESLPAWSPLGDKIAFSSRAVDTSANVHLMNPDGTGDVSLPAPGNLPGVEDSWPTWSPDGAMIGFHSRRDDAGGEEIYRMNRDGSNVVRLTFNGPGAFDIFPAWSPDGTRIVWNSVRNGATNFGEVFTMNATDGTGVVRITNNDAVDQRCDWQPLCTIYGAGDITGTPGNDIICGSDGPDRIWGGGGNDIILGLGGDDQILGNAGGNDRIFGGAGNDKITGQGGADIIDGGTGIDQCIAPTRNCP